MSSRKKRLRHDAQRPILAGWRQTAYDIIFEADSTFGRLFDIALLVAILLSITVISLETVQRFDAYDGWFVSVEIALTLLFTAEYVFRLACVKRPLKYLFSFWGIIDLLSFLPTYFSLFVGDAPGSYVALRSVRLLRVFRVLKLWRMMDEANELGNAIWRARNKIIVFLSVVLVAVTISGTLMYNIENLSIHGQEVESQFTSIPQSMYWAIVTMTTVGYGDVVPKTTIGKMISAILILLGYSLIIVPSTFVSAEIIQQVKGDEELHCGHCGAPAQRPDAQYCYRCGQRTH